MIYIRYFTQENFFFPDIRNTDRQAIIVNMIVNIVRMICIRSAMPLRSMKYLTAFRMMTCMT